MSHRINQFSEYIRNNKIVCAGKVAYPNAENAMKQNRKKKIGHNKHNHEVKAYRCPTCGRWHLARRDDKSKRAGRMRSE